MIPKAQVTIYIVSRTGWNREWYFPLHRFRAYLNRTMQAILDLLESNQAYKHFVLDGQAIVLEDYLELFPQDRERIQRLVFEANERPCTGLSWKRRWSPWPFTPGLSFDLI